MKDDEQAYMVMRNCCTSGNCMNCQDLPFGKTRRVSQMGDAKLTKKKAETIAANWSSYAPTVEKWEHRD